MTRDTWGPNFNDGSDPTRTVLLRTNPWHMNLNVDVPDVGILGVVMMVKKFLAIMVLGVVGKCRMNVYCFLCVSPLPPGTS
jgi:hypothetical protein